MINKTRPCRLNIFIRPIFHFYRRKSTLGPVGRVELDTSRQVGGRALPQGCAPGLRWLSTLIWTMGHRLIDKGHVSGNCYRFPQQIPCSHSPRRWLCSTSLFVQIFLMKKFFQLGIQSEPSCLVSTAHFWETPGSQILVCYSTCERHSPKAYPKNTMLITAPDTLTRCTTLYFHIFPM